MDKKIGRRALAIAVVVVMLAGMGLTVFATMKAGDVNGDGKITVFDAQMIAESNAGLRELTPEQAERAETFSVRDLIHTILNAEPEATEPTEPPASTDPSEPAEPEIPADAIAAVTNAGETSYVTSVSDLSAAVSATGNTLIKLLTDIDHNTLIKLPYSCTLDLNGHTIRTNPTTNSGIEIAAAGSVNQTTTIKNGKLVSYFIAVKVTKGAIVLDNMTVEALYGPCVGLYDNAAYASGNAITNSALISPDSCVEWMTADTDYSATSMTISNTDLIANANKTSNVIFARNGANCKYSNVYFGDNVNMYSYAADPALGALENTFFNGEVVAKESNNASVTVGDVTYSGMNLWTTEPTNEPIKILMVGNSFCLSFTEELYDLAEEAGKEIYIANLYYGGCSMERHWKSLTGEWKTTYDGFYVTDALGRGKHGTITNIKDAIHFQDWDIISLQQHFDVQRSASLDAAKASCTPYVENMYNYMRENFPDAELYWHQTWAYEVGYKYPANRDDDPTNDIPGVDVPDVTVQNRQRDIIIEASNWIAEANNVDQIPCGAAWAIARANPNITEDPCKDDNCHDGTVEGGQYLNACTWFETLFLTSCVGSERISFSDYKLDAALAAELQAAAHQAVADMYGEDYAK